MIDYYATHLPDQCIAQYTQDINEQEVAGSIEDDEIYLIVDISGSMASYTSLYTSYIPNLLTHLGLSKDKKCHLLPFASTTKYYFEPYEGQAMIYYYTHYSGGTAAETPAIHLRSMVFDPSKIHRFYFFTDGGFNSQESALVEWDLLKEKLINENVECQTSAFRIGSSAEAIGLVAFLRMNKSITELPLYDLAIGDLQGTLFPGISSKPSFKLDNDSCIYTQYPWTPLKSTMSVKDKEYFFVKTSQDMTIKPLTTKILMSVINSWLVNFSFDSFVKQKTNQEISKILVWINKAKDSIAEPPKSQTKYKYLFDLRQQDSDIGKIIEKIRMLNKTEQRHQLNSQQQANYLRELTDTTLGRSTAKRAAKIGENDDIESTLKTEFKNLKLHIHELDHLSDDTHQKSFISLESTLSAFRFIAKDLQESEIDSFSSSDLLGLLHIVGIGVSSTIGDFPDPMSYFIDNVSFVFVSLADVLHAEVDHEVIHAPGSQLKINNVIPVFEHPDLFKFACKYLRHSLDLLCGIGMRRVLALIPQTFKYTLLNGCFGCMNEKPQEFNFKLIHSWVPQLEYLFNGWFDYVPALLVDQGVLPNGSPRLIYNGNNGISNMIIPIYDILTKHIDKLSYLPALYRGLYSFEYAAVARRIMKFKQDGHKDVFFNDCIHTDLENSNKWSFKTDYLDKVLENKSYIDGMFLVEIALTKSLPEFKEFKLTHLVIQEKLKLDYPFKEFLYFTIIQGFLHKNKSERVELVDDKELHCIADYQLKETAYKEMDLYVNQLYEVVQLKLKKERLAKEIIKACHKFIDKLVDAPYSEFIRLYKEGYTVENEKYSFDIVDQNFKHLWGLLNKNVVDIDRKVYFFLSGGSDGLVFNRGNVLMQYLFVGKEFISDEHYQEIKGNMKLYQYRPGKVNRHGHSNETPSYFAMGFSSFEDFEKQVSKEEAKQYLVVHKTCCTPFSRTTRRK